MTGSSMAAAKLDEPPLTAHSSCTDLQAPGTEFLYDVGRTHDALQHVQDGDDRVLLVPQPSLTDPNDPLRWPKWKKWMTFMNALTYSFLGGVTGPIMAAGLDILSARFDQPLQALVYANGATLICQGVFTTIWMPFAIKFGRRPVYLLSAFLMGAACVWLGRASESSYNNLLLARAFLGAFEAPIESIVPSTVTDLFFLHDRGEKVSLYSLSVLSGNELGPVFSAILIQRLGTAWAFYLIGAVIHVNALTILLAMPETKYTGPRPAFLSYEAEEVVVVHQHDEARRDSLVCVHGRIKPRSAWSDLVVWREADPHVSLGKAFVRPFLLVTYPTVLWASVVYGMSLSWNVILASLVSQLFGAADDAYRFDSQAQGLVFLSPFVGSVLGTYLCGPLSDRIATYYTKRNGGVREPEMRLPTCALAAALVFLGALVTGVTYRYRTHWMGPVVGFGVVSAGAQMGATLSMSYALDCHKELSVELMVTVAVIKSSVAWIWTWFISDWLEADGALVVFMAVASINVFVYALTVPLGWYGKNIRSWTSDVDMTGRSGSIIKRI